MGITVPRAGLPRVEEAALPNARQTAAPNAAALGGGQPAAQAFDAVVKMLVGRDMLGVNEIVDSVQDVCPVRDKVLTSYPCLVIVITSALWANCKIAKSSSS